MKRISILFLALLLSACLDSETPVDTCAGLKSGSYDIQDIAVNGLFYDNTTLDYYYWRYAIPIKTDQVVTHNNFILELKATSTSLSAKTKSDWLFNFSPIKLAVACSLAPPATQEIISMLNITSNNEFDDTHTIGSNLNELFTVEYVDGRGVNRDFYLNNTRTYNLNEFVNESPQGMKYIHLKLIRSPTLSKVQNFKIEYMQTDGDYYERYLDTVTFK